MNSKPIIHHPVLKNEVFEYLSPQAGDWIVDATLGFGGHSQGILERIGETGLLIGIDQDPYALQIAGEALKNYPNTLFFNRNFEDIEKIVLAAKRKKGPHKINGILFDLGMSSLHVEDPDRGFSFQREGPLDMRFDPKNPLTAFQIVNQWSYEKLLNIFKTYGEEPHHQSEKFVRAILDARRKGPIRTTRELAFIISSLFNQKFGKRHPATRVFQALRIAVNRELDVLPKALQVAAKIISRGGKLAVISFHSLEDQIVKNFFRDYSRRDNPPQLQLLTKKPVCPSEEEIRMNPRARSAKLRAALRIL